MLQGLGSQWKVLGSELTFPTAEIFKTRKLGLTCRIRWAHSFKVNCVIVSSSKPPSMRIVVLFFFNPHLVWWVAFVPKLVFSPGCFRREETTLGPSSCPWAVLLYWHPLDAVQLFTVSTISDIATPLLFSLLCGLAWFLRTMGLELKSCFVAPSRQQEQQKGRGAKPELVQREGRKSRGENEIPPTFLAGYFCVSWLSGAVEDT